jgi:hypothetical protein
MRRLKVASSIAIASALSVGIGDYSNCARMNYGATSEHKIIISNKPRRRIHVGCDSAALISINTAIAALATSAADRLKASIPCVDIKKLSIYCFQTRRAECWRRR